MERDRVDNVWDCIAMHASNALARHKSPETRYSSRGTSVDVRGTGAEVLHPGFVRTVLDRWPRHDFPHLFPEVLRDEVWANPESTRMSWSSRSQQRRFPDSNRPTFLRPSTRAPASPEARHERARRLGRHDETRRAGTVSRTLLTLPRPAQPSPTAPRQLSRRISPPVTTSAPAATPAAPDDKNSGLPKFQCEPR